MVCGPRIPSCEWRSMCCIAGTTSPKHCAIPDPRQLRGEARAGGGSQRSTCRGRLALSATWGACFSACKFDTHHHLVSAHGSIKRIRSRCEPAGWPAGGRGSSGGSSGGSWRNFWLIQLRPTLGDASSRDRTKPPTRSTERHSGRTVSAWRVGGGNRCVRQSSKDAAMIESDSDPVCPRCHAKLAPGPIGRKKLHLKVAAGSASSAPSAVSGKRCGSYMGTPGACVPQAQLQFQPLAMQMWHEPPTFEDLQLVQLGRNGESRHPCCASRLLPFQRKCRPAHAGSSLC